VCYFLEVVSRLITRTPEVETKLRGLRQTILAGGFFPSRWAKTDFIDDLPRSSKTAGPQIEAVERRQIHAARLSAVNGIPVRRQMGCGARLAISSTLGMNRAARAEPGGAPLQNTLTSAAR